MSDHPPISAQEAYYTERWNQFQRANHLDLVRIARVLGYVAKIELPHVPKFCDFGCGAGWSTAILGLFGDSLGFDLSDTTAAQARFAHCKFVSGNALEWDYPPDEFDFVTSIEVIEHVPYDSQRDYLTKALRMLKPGGHLILTTPNRRTLDAMDEDKRRRWSIQPIECVLFPRDLRRLLVSSGFRVLDLDSLVLGQAHAGSYRLASSTRVRQTFESLGLADCWERFLNRRMYGLHLIAFAQKPVR